MGISVLKETFYQKAHLLGSHYPEQGDHTYTPLIQILESVFVSPPGDTHTLSDGSSITLAGEVGLLTRNIVVEGNTYEGFEDDSFGGRVLVSKLTHDGVDYVGTAQIDGVEFRNMGQESFTDLDDPRYSLAFVGLDAIEEDSSYVKRSSFNLNYNVALGLIGTSGMVVDDNVIYFTLDSGECVCVCVCVCIYLFVITGPEP
ncbi:Fibrocystin-L [Portunus trituberculatus]|uniref:Fibrocystin-L n=1 Tax=Portunus trituberculatus TaxID=210409 RepID=A0A5B7IAL3_PORTR|nr:Fibrocystin-L [Portunus trituberculatus]